MKELISAINSSEHVTQHELSEIKNFLLRNLNNFKTRKKKNSDKILQLMIRITYDESLSSIIAVLDEQPPQKSLRMQTLQYTLKKQIIHKERYKDIGVSKIYPDATVKEPAIPELARITSLEDLMLYLSSPQENYHLTPLEIVTVYGNTKKHGNTFGHAILKIGDAGYLHINTLYARPYYIARHGLKNYLMENESFIVDIQSLAPVGDDYDELRIVSAIKNYASHKWFWMITHHNCLSFAREVASACGISKDQLGYSRGEAKLPIPFRMERGAGEASILKNNDSVSENNPISVLDKFLNNIKDDAVALASAVQQKFWKNKFRPDNAKIDLLPNHNNKQRYNSIKPRR